MRQDWDNDAFLQKRCNFCLTFEGAISPADISESHLSTCYRQSYGGASFAAMQLHRLESLPIIPGRTREVDMWGSPIHFGTASETRCSICARSVTLELSKTDEQGQAVHELCYVRATLARFRGEAERRSLPHKATTPAIAIASAGGPELEGSFWKAFEFVRW